MSDNISGQNIWLTGASSGIGESLLVRLLADGAKVIATSRNLDNLSALQQQYPTTLTLVPADVADIESVKTCVDIISQKFSHLDKVIFNAGVCHYLDMPNFTGEIIRKNFAVNFFGMVNCLEYSLPLLMRAQSPHIVGMSSSVAYLAIPRAEGYGASKAAVLYLLRCLQAHPTTPKIDISIICPGFVQTPLTARNDFPMPFMLSAEQAAAYILKGILKRQKEISFPRSLVAIFKFIAILPDFLRIKILSRISSKK